MITENDNTETSEALKRLLLFSGLIFFCTFIILVNKTKVSTNDALTLFPVISLMTIVFIACIVFICRQGIKSQEQAESGLESAIGTTRRSVAPTVFVCRPGSRVVVSNQNTTLNQHQDGNEQTIRYLPAYQTIQRGSLESSTWQVALDSNSNQNAKPPPYSIVAPQTLQVNELSPALVNAAQRNDLPLDAPPAYDEIEGIRPPTTSQTRF